MPIGKNALKRVSNNGYSSVNTSLPDMENSEIVENATVQTEEKTAPKKVTRSTKKAETKTEVKSTTKATAKTETAKSTTKATAKTETATKSTAKAKKSTEEKADTTTHPDVFVKVALGMDMPEYLL